MKSGATPRRLNHPLRAYGSMAWVSFSFLIIGNEECFRFTHLTLELRYTPSLNVLVLRRHVLLSADLAAHLSILAFVIYPCSAAGRFYCALEALRRLVLPYTSMRQPEA